MESTTLVKNELIGRNVTIKHCPDPTWINQSGRIIDETKNTFLIQIGKKQKRVAKKKTTFEFTNHGKKTIIEGSQLLYRPEDRIKKAR